MAEIGLVHLVRARNGLRPFDCFLDACARCPAGFPYDLLIVFKGFSGSSELEPYRSRLKDLPHRELLVNDLGLDLRAYSVACRSFEQPTLCFLNSYCVPLGSDWLKKMFDALQRPGAGAVGATGSWESMYTNFDRVARGHEPMHRRLSRPLRRRLNRRLFLPIPNYHLRTNAFIISRALMVEIWPRHILTKATAYLFENGKNSFTQRILRRGLKPLVVDREGRIYEKEEWARSNTFRQANQENLLIADNQTRNYADGDPGVRRFLSTLAWGDQANPALPPE